MNCGKGSHVYNSLSEAGNRLMANKQGNEMICCTLWVLSYAALHFPLFTSPAECARTRVELRIVASCVPISGVAYWVKVGEHVEELRYVTSDHP